MESNWQVPVKNRDLLGRRKAGKAACSYVQVSQEEIQGLEKAEENVDSGT